MTQSRHAEPNGTSKTSQGRFSNPKMRFQSFRARARGGARGRNESAYSIRPTSRIWSSQPCVVDEAHQGSSVVDPGSSLAVAEPACAVRSRCGGPWNSYARRAASHSLAKILDSRIERVGGFDRSRRAGDLELIRIAAHDRAAIDEAVEHERKAAPGEKIRPVKQAEMQMWGGGVAGVAELADFDPLL